MADVVFYDVGHIQSGKQDTYDRVDQIQVVRFVDIDIGGQHTLYGVDQVFQYQSGYRSEQPDDETQQQDELLLLDMFLSPGKHPQKPSLVFYACMKIYHLHPFPCNHRFYGINNNL